MLPFYDDFGGYATENGKVLGHYDLLKFPTPV
jgi:hypothetical protein